MQTKHHEQAEARRLRAEGRSLKEIAEQLGVAKSSVSLWVRDLPTLSPEGRSERARRAAEARWQPERARRQRAHQATRDEASGSVGELSGRELLLAGVLLYWAEGEKSKAYRPARRLRLINSDPDVIRFYLAWLDHLGVSREDLNFRVCIHESADVPAAQQFWAELVGAEEGQMRRPTLKRHNPTTVRKNVGASYRGCLVVDVRRSADLYRRVEGWWYGIVGAAARPVGVEVRSAVV